MDKKKFIYIQDPHLNHLCFLYFLSFVITMFMMVVVFFVWYLLWYWLYWYCFTLVISVFCLLPLNKICDLLLMRGWVVIRAPDNLKLAGNWPKVAAMCGVQNYSKKQTYIGSFKLIIPLTRVFMHLLGLLDQFGWQPPFLLAHFGWWTLISEAISGG